jgi:acetyl esterase/lipase
MASHQLEAIVQMLRSRPDLGGLTVQERRAGFETLAQLLPVPPDVRCEEVDAAGVRAEWLTPTDAATDRVLLHLHGGGYVVGSLRTVRQLAARIALASGLRCLSVDYRLAPEHPFPAAVEDATAAYRWLVGTGLDPSNVVLSGDSAGGGLVIATLVSLRDAGVPLPAAGVCLSPWVDLEATGQTMTTKSGVDPMVERKGLLEFADYYLAGADPRTPLASPIYADLRRLPPLLIQVGTAEVLLDDANRLATRARDAGVDVTLEPWEEMIHVWHFFAALLPEGQQAVNRIGEFIQKHLG